MTDLKKVSFAAACRTFFGPRPGTSLKDFIEEIKALTPQDRQDLISEFQKIGIDATLQL